MIQFCILQPHTFLFLYYKSFILFTKTSPKSCFLFYCSNCSLTHVLNRQTNKQRNKKSLTCTFSEESNNPRSKILSAPFSLKINETLLHSMEVNVWNLVWKYLFIFIEHFKNKFSPKPWTVLTILVLGSMHYTANSRLVLMLHCQDRLQKQNNQTIPTNQPTKPQKTSLAATHTVQDMAKAPWCKPTYIVFIGMLKL